MQRFLTDVAAPVMRAAGFTRSSGTFRYLHPGGHLAVVQLRSRRLMHHELEFYVEEGVVVQAWREYLAETMDLVDGMPSQASDLATASHAEGLIIRRLLPRPDRVGGLWQLDS